MIPIFTVIIFPRMEYRFFFFPAIIPPHFYPPFSYKGIIPCRKREVTPLTVPAQQKEAIAVRAISCISVSYTHLDVYKRQVLRRTKREEDAALHWKNLKLDLASGTISLPEGKSHPAELSRNELKILYYLMKHAGKIVSREELVDYLWDEEIFIDDNALSVNMTRLRSKLESIGAPDFIGTRRGLGYQI